MCASVWLVVLADKMEGHFLRLNRVKKNTNFETAAFKLPSSWSLLWWNFSWLQILSKNIGFFKEEDSEAPSQNQPNQLKADEIIPWVFSSWSGFQAPRNCKKKTQENRQKYPSGKKSAYDHLMPAKISGRCNWIPTTQTQPPGYHFFCFPLILSEAVANPGGSAT